MRSVSFAATVVALAVAAPAVAQHKAPPHHDPASVLNLRVQSIDLQIDILRDRGMIGREEALALHQQSLILQQRLFGLGPREVEDVERGVDRLANEVRFAADDARAGGHIFDRGEGDRFDDGDRFDSEDSGYHRSDPRGDPFARLEEIRRRTEHRL